MYVTSKEKKKKGKKLRKLETQSRKRPEIRSRDTKAWLELEMDQKNLLRNTPGAKRKTKKVTKSENPAAVHSTKDPIHPTVRLNIFVPEKLALSGY